MPTALKVILIIIGALAILILMIGVGAWYWWDKHGGALIETYQEGQRFGETANNDQCLNEAIKRLLECDGFNCELNNNLYFVGCLETSEASPGFCEEVPEPSELLASVQWRTEQCEELNITKQTCPELFAEVQNYCHP